MNNSTVIARGIEYRWPESGASPSADSFLLADFASERVRGKVCDLCGGAGLISLLLCSKNRGESIVCGDIDPRAVEFCNSNAASAGFEDRIAPRLCDVNDIRNYFSPGSFDTVVCNPPYHERGGKPSLLRCGARSEAECSLERVCLAAGDILKNGGRFFICMKASRLAELMVAMRAAKTEPKRLRFVSHGEGHEPFLVLCEGIKGAAPSVVMLPELRLYGADGRPTAESDRIYYGIGE